MASTSLAHNFDRDGFVLLPGFLTREEAATARGLVESILLAPPDTACERPHNTLLPLRWNHELVKLCLRSDQRMQALGEAITAEDLKWISAYVSIKDPQSMALWWHQDWWCWDHPATYLPPATQIAVMCYLADTNAENGGPRLLPGSHLQSAPIHAELPEPHSHAAQSLHAEHAAMADHPGQITPLLRAGDAIAIDYRLPHGTHGNSTDIRRDCVLLSFTPAWKHLPEDIRAHLIDHPALPQPSENPGTLAHLVPAYNGARQSLTLNRMAPREFHISA